MKSHLLYEWVSDVVERIVASTSRILHRLKSEITSVAAIIIRPSSCRKVVLFLKCNARINVHGDFYVQGRLLNQFHQHRVGRAQCYGLSSLSDCCLVPVEHLQM